MEFKIARESFLDALSRTQGVVERKNTMPVLSNVLLEADKNGLRITATDLEVAIVLQVPAQILKPGKITLSCRSLYDIVREINAPEIRVHLNDNDKVELNAGKSLFKIPGLAASEFPSLPKVEAKTQELPCELIQNMLEKASFAMSTDETRHNLAGILLQREEAFGLRMVATDGHRLALIDCDVQAENLGKIKVIIPKKGISELRKMVSDGGNFELAVGEKNLFARKGNETLYVRLVDAEFPQYDRVIPKDNDKLAVIPRDRAIGALRRVALLANERSRGVVMTLSPGNMEISISNPDLGEAREEIEVEYKGERLNVGFNARYFLDALAVMNDEKVTLSFYSDLTPCLIKSVEDQGFLCVVMPMRI